MIKFNKEKVLVLYGYLIEASGGKADVRDMGLLDSALESVYATFDGVELYPTKEEKGARLGFALVSNHAFVDGNKRIGTYIMLSFLEVNGVKLNCSDSDIVALGIGIASGKLKYEDVLDWVKANKEIKA
ncbi:MAG: type II toxin-antitoxin system death-on-curing family toxin [Firmicutes bacterium]|nr:type II toxin-antitoxin system death-on-curing family toxin [Bacillota bacterium]